MQVNSTPTPCLEMQNTHNIARNTWLVHSQPTASSSNSFPSRHRSRPRLAKGSASFTMPSDEPSCLECGPLDHHTCELSSQERVQACTCTCTCTCTYMPGPSGARVSCITYHVSRTIPRALGLTDEDDDDSRMVLHCETRTPPPPQIPPVWLIVLSP